YPTRGFLKNNSNPYFINILLFNKEPSEWPSPKNNIISLLYLSKIGNVSARITVVEMNNKTISRVLINLDKLFLLFKNNITIIPTKRISIPCLEPEAKAINIQAKPIM